MKLFDETSRAAGAQSKTLSIHQNESQVLMASMDITEVDEDDYKAQTMSVRKYVQFDMSKSKNENAEAFSLKNLKLEMQEVEKV